MTNPAAAGLILYGTGHKKRRPDATPPPRDSAFKPRRMPTMGKTDPATRGDHPSKPSRDLMQTQPTPPAAGTNQRQAPLRPLQTGLWPSCSQPELPL